MSYDAIIISAGLGGLTAGAKLSVEGKKVLVIEQHNLPGGCATTFKRNALKIEVGLHMMDGPYDDDPKQKIFKELGVFDHVKFIRIPEFYRFVKPGVEITIPFNYKEAINVLINRYPAEKSGILKFFKIILAIRKETIKIPHSKWRKLFFMSVFLRFKKPLKELVNQYYSTIFFDVGISNQKQMTEYYSKDFAKRTANFVN